MKIVHLVARASVNLLKVKTSFLMGAQSKKTSPIDEKMRVMKGKLSIELLIYSRTRRSPWIHSG